MKKGLKRWNTEPGAKFETNPPIKTLNKWNQGVGVNATSNNIAMTQTARRTNRLVDAVKGI